MEDHGMSSLSHGRQKLTWKWLKVGHIRGLVTELQIEVTAKGNKSNFLAMSAWLHKGTFLL